MAGAELGVELPARRQCERDPEDAGRDETMEK
jgi:hypothetical protein